MSLMKKVFTICLSVVLITGCMAFNVQAEGIVQMYAWDGTSYMINESEVEAYKAVGLYLSLDEVRTTLYAPDGRSIVLFNAQVNEYLNQGWYYVPVTFMYDQNGTEYVIAKSEVEAYKAVGLSETKPEAVVTVYSPNGGAKNISPSEVNQYLSEGWSYTNPDTYFGSDVPNYSKITYAWLKNAYEIDGGIIHVYDYYYEDVEAYKNYLLSNGWVLQEYVNGIYNYTKGNALSAFYIENNELKLVYIYDYAYELYYPGLPIPDYAIVTGKACLGCEEEDNLKMHPHYLDYQDLELYLSVLALDNWQIIEEEYPDAHSAIWLFEKDGTAFILEVDETIGLVVVITPN